MIVAVYRRFRELIREGAKFLIVGAVAFVIAFAGADLLHFDAGLGKYVSVTIATAVATVVAFIGNGRWTFREREGHGTIRDGTLFFVLNGVGLVMQYASVAVVQDGMGLQGKLWFNLANFVGIALGTLFRFWSYRKWVWVRPGQSLLAQGQWEAAPGRSEPPSGKSVPEPRQPGGRHRKGRSAVPEEQFADAARLKARAARTIGS